MNDEDQELCSFSCYNGDELHPKLKQLSIEEFFNLCPLEVMSMCCLSYQQYLDIRDTVSRCIAPPPTNVLSFYQSNALVRLSTRIPTLDHHLLGGLLPGTVTEISGPPGSGKTQFCMTMSVYCSANSKRVIYIDTEGTFSAHRLLEIIKGNDYNIEDTATGVMVYRELTCNGLKRRLSSIESDLCSKEGKNACGLICVDSIASLLRKEFDTQTVQGLTHRNTLLHHYITQLKLLAEKYSLVVIVTNQIVVKIPPSVCHGQEPDGVFPQSVGVVCPSLGNTWYHCVNTRLMLEIDDVTMGTRKLRILKSPVSGLVAMVIKITSKGFVNHNTSDII